MTLDCDASLWDNDASDITRQMMDCTPHTAMFCTNGRFSYNRTVECRRGESNPQEGAPHTILSRARLPVPPLRHQCPYYIAKKTNVNSVVFTSERFFSGNERKQRLMLRSKHVLCSSRHTL